MEEREYTDDQDAYETFVGNITPQEFVKPFGSINAAIDNLIDNWVWNEPVPSWLKKALFCYIEDKIDPQ
jgi:hypothetical protein